MVLRFTDGSKYFGISESVFYILLIGFMSQIIVADPRRVGVKNDLLNIVI